MKKISLFVILVCIFFVSCDPKTHEIVVTNPYEEDVKKSGVQEPGEVLDEANLKSESF